MFGKFNKTVKLILEGLPPAIENQYKYWIVSPDNGGSVYPSTKQDWDRWMQSERQKDILINYDNKVREVRGLVLNKLIMVELLPYFDSAEKVKLIADQILNDRYQNTPSSGSAH